MAITASDKGGGTDFAPIPAGMHHAVCYGVVDLGTQPSYNPKYPPRRKVLFIFELPGQRGEFVKDGVTKNLPRAISEKYTNSLSAKSNLRPLLESWRGRPFTEDELKGFDLEKVCGANALLNLIHEHKGDKTYTNISTINPLMSGTKKLIAENPPLKFSLDSFPGNAPIVFPENMPEWIRQRIMDSDEYIAREERARQQLGRPGQPQPGPDGQAFPPGGVDEDVPF